MKIKMMDYLIFIFFFLLVSCGQKQVLNENSNSKKELELPIFDGDVAFNFAVISDLNKSYGSTTYLNDLNKSINYITTHNIDLVLSTGDMVAGQKKNLDYQSMWKSFHQHVSSPLLKSKILFAPSPGNHDASSSRAFENERNIYENTFKQRKKDLILKSVSMISGSKYPLYYAFKIKELLFISLDATSLSPLDDIQIKWLENTLKNNKDIKIKVIFGHVPLLPFAYNKSNEYLGLGKSSFTLNFEKMLNKYNVDLFLSGHHHVYYKGHRNGHTKFISVPLLGTGTRKLLTDGNFKSERGFLVFSYSNTTGLTMKSIRSSDLSEISDNELPDYIRIPGQDSSTCKNCKDFPTNLFIPNSDRKLFLKKESI